MDFEAARARVYYAESRPLIDLVAPRSRSSLRALVAIYASLLDLLEQSNYDVFARRISLSVWRKLGIAVRSLAGRTSKINLH